MIEWFLRNPVAANLLMVAILVLGIKSAFDLREEGFPKIPPSWVTISVFYDSGSAKQAEENITLKIEEAIENVAGIKDFESRSTRTGSTVTVRKEQDTDLDKLLNDVKARVDAITALPRGAERPVVTAAEWDETALRINLYGEVSKTLLQSLAERLREDLLLKPGITTVYLQGDKTPEITIEVDEARLQTYDLTLVDVSSAVARESVVEVSGVLRDENTITRLTADAPRYDKDDFAAIALRSYADGGKLRLGDVAKITDGFDSSPHTWLRFQQQPSVSVRVVVDRNDDIIQVVKDARQVVEDWRAEGRLPEGVSIAAWDDRSEVITTRLSTLLFNGAAGILLVIILLSVFLEARVAFWVALGLPICFAGALIAMGDWILGISINEVSTFGFIVAMGIIVDDAIVVGESITARQEKSPTLDATLEGVRLVALPTLTAGTTTAVAFASLAFVVGDFGHIFSQFSLIVAACLVFSMIESKLILPAHLRPKRHHAAAAGKSGRLRRRVQTGFETFKTRLFLPTLEKAIAYRYTTLLILVSMSLAGFGLLNRDLVRSVFFPSIPFDVVYADITMQSDASFGFTESTLNRMEGAVYEIAEAHQEQHGDSGSPVSHVQTRMTGDLRGNIRVALASDVAHPMSAPEFGRQWREAIGRPEGLKQLRVWDSEALPEALEIELLAPSLAEAEAGGRAMLAVLQQMPSIMDIRHNIDESAPQIRLELTPQGRALGLTTQELAQQLQQSFFGFETQRIQRGRDEIKVRVRYPDDARESMADLWAMHVRTPSGQTVLLESVAVAVTEHPVGERTRIDGRAAIAIRADVNKDITSPEAIIDGLEQDYFPEFRALHPDVLIEFGGEAEELALVSNSLRDIVVFALIVIYALLAVVLKSYLAPIIILTVIPFGVAGAIFGHLIHDLSFSILSLFGVMALGGVVVNDSLLLVVRYRQIRPSQANTHDAVLKAAAERVRAIILTSVTTYVGLIPLMANPSIQAAYLKPAAASLAYGVMFATVITLVLVPILIMVGDDIRRVFARWFATEEPAV